MSLSPIEQAIIDGRAYWDPAKQNTQWRRLIVKDGNNLHVVGTVQRFAERKPKSNTWEHKFHVTINARVNEYLNPHGPPEPISSILKTADDARRVIEQYAAQHYLLGPDTKTIKLTMTEIEAIGWALDLAYIEQESFYENDDIGSADDYGLNHMLALALATAADKLGFNGERERWVNLAAKYEKAEHDAKE